MTTKPEDIFVGNTHQHWKEVGQERGWIKGSINRSMLDEALRQMDESTLLLDGFDEAFIGFSQRINEPILAVYSYEEIVRVCMERDGMEYDEAVEYVDFNVVGAWVGEQTPIIVMPLGNY